MIEEQESITAQLCLFARAFHSNYGKEKIFDDYLSFDLMGREQYEEIGQLIENDFDPEKFDRNKWFCHKNIKDILYKYILPIPLSRIKFAEIELENFAKLKGAMGEKIQYVICGAGMDSFAFRNTNNNSLLQHLFYYLVSKLLLQLHLHFGFLHFQQIMLGLL